MSLIARPRTLGDLLRVDDVLLLIPVSRSSLYAGIRKGLYPRPVKIGPRSVAWRASEIAATVKGFDSTPLAD